MQESSHGWKHETLEPAPNLIQVVRDSGIWIARIGLKIDGVFKGLAITGETPEEAVERLMVHTKRHGYQWDHGFTPVRVDGVDVVEAASCNG